MKHAILIKIIFALMLGAVLASCNAGGPEEVAVSMREFSFAPEAVSVSAGAEVTIILRNLGALEHNFHIMDLGKEVDSVWAESDEAGALFTKGSLKGGAVETVSFTAPNAPGEYQFLCSVPSHFELGMHGTLTVTGP